MSTVQSLSMRMFCGFRSRCMIRREWQAAMPLSSCSMNHYRGVEGRADTLISLGSRFSLGPHCSMKAFRSLSTNSKMRYSFWSEVTTSLSLRVTHSTYLTMFSCSTSLSSDISRIAVLGIPSFSTSIFMRLTAMTSLV